MQEWARRLGELGVVESFDYPYMKAGRKSPDKQPVLVAAHAAALAGARARHGADRKVVLAGKSMGSRMGCHLAVEQPEAGIAALVCFGYPLRAGATGALRDEVLRALRAPILFLQGSKDPLCPLADLETARARMTAPSELFVVPGGNHSLEVGARDLRATGRSQGDWDRAVLAEVARFLASHGAA
jgi:predicted alpha/beta-hydrolase family hydrolase